MPVKLKYANNNATRTSRPAPARHRLGMRLLSVFLIVAIAVALVGSIIFGYYYVKYQHIVDARLASGPIFANTSQIYAAPKEIRTGQKLTAASIARDLRQAGYNSNNQLGTFQLTGDTISIKPGPQSYHATDGATITTTNGEVRSIPAENGASLAGYSLEPQLITSLSTRNKNRASAASSPTTKFRHVWSRPSSPSKTATSSSTADSTTFASLNAPSSTSPPAASAAAAQLYPAAR